MLRHARTHSEQVVVILFETSTIAERFDAKQMDLFARSGQCLHFQFTHRYFFEAWFSGLTTCLGSSTIHPLRCLSCQRFAEGFASIFTGSHFCVSQAEASLLDGCPLGYGPPGADPFWPPGDHGNIQPVERDLKVQNVQTLPVVVLNTAGASPFRGTSLDGKNSSSSWSHRVSKCSWKNWGGQCDQVDCLFPWLRVSTQFHYPLHVANLEDIELLRTSYMLPVLMDFAEIQFDDRTTIYVYACGWLRLSKLWLKWLKKSCGCQSFLKDSWTLDQDHCNMFFFFSTPLATLDSRHFQTSLNHNTYITHIYLYYTYKVRLLINMACRNDGNLDRQSRFNKLLFQSRCCGILWY